MFTGLIEDVGTLASLSEISDGWKLSVHTGLPVQEISEGDSISVNGACLTVEKRHVDRGFLVFHALHETLNRTNLSYLSPGDTLNLERAVKASDRFDGHIVNAHVDTCATVRSVMRLEKDLVLTVTLPDSLSEFVVEKGSVAVNGVSLTVASLSKNAFSVRVIPKTWQKTNLRSLQSGDRANLEVDVLGKYVKRQSEVGRANSLRSSVTMNTLQEAGFTS